MADYETSYELYREDTHGEEIIYVLELQVWYTPGEAPSRWGYYGADPGCPEEIEWQVDTVNGKKVPAFTLTNDEYAEIEEYVHDFVHGELEGYAEAAAEAAAEDRAEAMAEAYYNRF